MPLATSSPAAAPWVPARRTVTLLTALGILVVGQMYVVLALIDPMSADFGVSGGQVTWTATAFGLAYATGFLFTGPLADRFGQRAMITGGLAACAVATAAVAAAPGLDWAMTLRAVQGLSASAFTPAALSYTAGRLAPAHRPVALTCLTSGMLASAVLMQIAAQAVESALGWRPVFLLGAAAMAGAVPVARAVLHGGGGDATADFRAAFTAMPRLLSRPRLLALYAVTVALMGSFVALYTAVALAGPPSVAGSPGAVLALRTAALPALVAVPLLTPLLRRWSALPRVASAMALTVPAVAAASVLGGQTLALAAVLLVFVSGVAAAAPAVVEAVGAAAGETRGAALALYACGMFIGASLGPVLAGTLAPTGFAMILRVVAGILAAGTIAALGAWRAAAEDTRRARPQDETTHRARGSHRKTNRADGAHPVHLREARDDLTRGQALGRQE
ncbi:MFS transporter [Streptantibioticus ferralitis]|uniref:MFS transporter n=1 Tax=Streptantibioticus ferralitis TaxID=236510 RepID=A0ABT5Z1B6_9ACTN|nr:MFS transporter [Streptantibioticus ferralitis]MDF2257553.1 MFS transporter [Streptantibioticus ferralitis]